METLRYSRRTALYVVVTLALLGNPFLNARANDFSLYGQLSNTRAGLCAATEVINSFIYLDNLAPGVFDSTPLIPRGMTNATARNDFAWFGWPGEPSGDSGYYKPGAGNPDVRLLQWKELWVQTFAPTVPVTFASMIGNVSGFPTLDFLRSENAKLEDVELIIQFVGKSSAHCVDLVSMGTDSNGNPTIQYQDPNNPKTLISQ